MKVRSAIRSAIIGIAVLGIPQMQIHGQDPDLTDPIRSLGLRYHRAFIIQHSKKLQDEFTQSNPQSIDLEYSWHLRKKAVWDYCTCYPRTGFALTCIDFDLGDTLGRSLAAYTFIEPYIKPGRRLNFAFRFGMGPAYMSSIYDENFNPDNLFFSTRISFILLFNLSLNYRLTDQWMLRVGANFNHISNGGVKEPNLGMNFPSLNLGTEYSFHKPLFPDQQKSTSLFGEDQKNRYDLLLSAALKAPEWTIENKQYLVTSAGLNYSRLLGRVFAVSFGGEWVSDRTIKSLIDEQELRDSSGELLDYNRLGMLAGVEWLFGRFIFTQQMGFYLYSPIEAKHPVYQRYGLSLRISEHIYSGINIKAHAQDADFMELRIGFYL